MIKKIIIALVVISIVGFVLFKIFYKVAPKSKEPIDTSSVFDVAAPFKISIFQSDIPGARVMAFAPGGALLVSQTSEGVISALPDRDSDGEADAVLTVASELNSPHGMAFLCDFPNPDTCKLYVAEEDALSVFDYNVNSLKATNKTHLLDLPSGGGHSTRTLLFMPSPDEKTLLISVGSSCNVCNEKDSNRASIIAYNVETKKSEQFAKGLRNAVFLEIHPVSGKIWATEMGRDLLGDDIPPDEINIVEKGKNYGWPICYGKNIHDDQFDKNTYIRNPCMEPFEIPSHIDLQAHSAPLGLSFFPEEGWPADYWHNLLVSFHGSWNRSTPTGYKVVRIKLDEQGNYLGTEDFITGWLKSDGTRIGRPADIKIMPGGVIYITDDDRGVVYRVTIGN